MRTLASRALTCLMLLSLSGQLQACNTPVFRYALERWRADPFELFVVHKEPLTAEQHRLIEQLEGGKEYSAVQANVTVRLIDASGELSEEEKAVVAEADLEQGPVLFVWPGWVKKPLERLPLDQKNVAALLDSPARRELARRLLKGDSAICLLLTSGDAARDEEAHTKLTALVSRLEKEIKLPEPDEEDLEALRGQEGTALPPLALRLSVQTVDASAPEERFLVRILRELAPREASLPMATWVFGRGRFLWPVSVADKDFAEIVEEDIRYLCGPCSCQVKAQNPGADLLMSVSWDALIVGDYVVDEDLPPLQSVSALLSATPSAPTTEEVASTAPPAEGTQPGEEKAAPVLTSLEPPEKAAAQAEGEGKLTRSVLWTVAGVASLVILGSGLILLRGKGGS